MGINVFMIFVAFNQINKYKAKCIILVSEKEPYGTKNTLKYFIGYNDNAIMIGYAKKFNENLTMSFGVNNKQLLKKYNKMWEKLKS